MAVEQIKQATTNEKKWLARPATFIHSNDNAFACNSRLITSKNDNVTDLRIKCGHFSLSFFPFNISLHATATNSIWSDYKHIVLHSRILDLLIIKLVCACCELYIVEMVYPGDYN